MTLALSRSGALSLLLAALALAGGCGDRPTAPPRSSPQLVEAGESWAVRAVGSARGVTLLTTRDGFDAPDHVARLTDSGLVELRVASEPIENLCAISETAGALIGETSVIVFDGDADVVSTPLVDVLGSGFRSWAIACAGRSTDDVYLASSHESVLVLAHWDGTEWSAQELTLAPASFDHSAAVTDAFLWVATGDGLARRPLAGGDFEIVTTANGSVFAVDDDSVLQDDDFFDAALHHDDAPSIDLERPDDPGDVAVTPDGRVWRITVESDGESETSFGGSTTVYHPYWASLIVSEVRDGVPVEVAHLSESYASDDARLSTAYAYVAGSQLIVSWGGLFYRLP